MYISDKYVYIANLEDPVIVSLDVGVGLHLHDDVTVLFGFANLVRPVWLTLDLYIQDIINYLCYKHFILPFYKFNVALE